MMACAIVSSPVSSTNPYGPPVADFLPEEDDPISSFRTVNFVDTTTDMPTSWQWQINGATFSIAQNPSYYFTSPGFYTIVLIASNSYGAGSKTRTYQVT